MLASKNEDTRNAPRAGWRKAIYYLYPLIAAITIEVVFFNIRYWIWFLGGTAEAEFSCCLPRFAILAALAYFSFAFRPSSVLHTITLRATKGQLAIIALVVGLHAVSFAVITQHVDEDQFFTAGTTKFDGAVYDDGQQYAYLADSILAGRTWLDLEVPDWLASMENPYDAQGRFDLAYETGEPFYWDFAFYKGRYYCYFGALPAVVLFVPFKAITGTDLRTDYAVAIFALLLSISIAVFLFKFLNRYARETTLGVYLLSFMLFSMGCATLTQVFYPLFYSLPPLAGMTCIFFGLAALLGARSQDGSIRKRALVLGSSLLACTLWCRPQLFLVISLVFPLFWKEIVSDRLFFSRKGIGNTLAVIIPCLILGVGVMLYNYVRFDSPLDFGASYNLTGFDMTAKSGGISLRAIVVALLFYVLMPLNISPVFPYLDEITWRSQIPVEPFYGSFFAFTPAALSVFGLWRFREQLKEKQLMGLCIVCCVIALILMLLSAQVASVSMRYFSDFAWALLIPALSVWIIWMELDRKTHSSVALTLFIVLVLIGEGLNYWNMLSIGKYAQLITMNPNIYMLFESWFAI